MIRATSFSISVCGALPSRRSARPLVRHRSRRHRLVRRVLPLLRAGGGGVVPAPGERSDRAAAPAAGLHAADVAAVAVPIAGETRRRDLGRRRRLGDDRAANRLHVRHPRARHRTADLRGVVPRRVRRRRDVHAAGVSGGSRDTARAGARQAMSVVDAAALGVPERFNAAEHFVDRNVADGRGSHVAIEYGESRISYDEVLANVNRTGRALRRLDVRTEERVLLLLFDSPDFVYSFFGAIKIGAVPIPLNTLWTPADYRHVIRDSRASVLVVHADLWPRIEKIPQADRRSLRQV